MASFAALAQPAAPQADPRPAADSAEATSAWTFNGFGTVSAVDVLPRDDWGFRREITQPSREDRHVRVDVDSRLGLQGDWRPDAQWELSGQLVLKPRTEAATAQESVAWAFVAYHPTPDWTLRAGRTSPDLFLLSDVRNVGFSYLWMRPSIEFYGWMPLSTLDGVDVAKQWSVGEVRWRAKVFGGQSKFSLAGSEPGGPDERGTTRPLLGGTLTADRDGLTVKATFVQARTRTGDAAQRAQLEAGLNAIAQLPLPAIAGEAAALRDSFPAGNLVTRYAALGISWDADPWQLQAEVSRTTGNFLLSQAWYGYASAGYRVGSVTPFVMFGRARASRSPIADPHWAGTLAPIVGAQNAALAQYAADAAVSTFNLDRQDQRSVSLGARWDVASSIALKLQVDDVRSAAFGGALWTNSDGTAHHAVVVSAGMDFVF